MNLNYLPCIGMRENWSPERGYTIERQKVVGGAIVVLGRITFKGEEADWFVCRYTPDGDPWPGKGGRRWWARGREAAVKAYDDIRHRREPVIDLEKAALVAEHFDAEREAAE